VGLVMREVRMGRGAVDLRLDARVLDRVSVVRLSGAIDCGSGDRML
jgi:hypothetical protein